MTEKDPHGKDAHEPGAKLDADKDYADTVLGSFAHALDEVVKVGTFGAKKYTKHGWKSVPDGITRYADARSRHWLKRHKGEAIDPDSGLLHLAHEAWNILAELTLMLQQQDPNTTEGHCAVVKQGPYAGVEL